MGIFTKTEKERKTCSILYQNLRWFSTNKEANKTVLKIPSVSHLCFAHPKVNKNIPAPLASNFRTQGLCQTKTRKTVAGFQEHTGTWDYSRMLWWSPQILSYSVSQLFLFCSPHGLTATVDNTLLVSLSLILLALSLNSKFLFDQVSQLPPV